MDKKCKNYTVAVLATIALMWVLCTQFTVSYGDVDSEKESLSAMENERADAQAILDALEAEKKDSQAYLNALDVEVSSIANHIYAIQQNIDEKEASAKTLRKQIKKAQRTINSQYDDMKLRIQYMYENGNASYLSMILDSKSLGDFLNRAEYIAELTKYDRSMLQEMMDKKKEIQAAKKSLESQLENLEILKAQVEAERKATEMLMVAKSEEIASVNNSIDNAENQIKSLDEDIQAQQELVSEMESIEARRKAEEESRRKAEEESRSRAAEEASKRAEEGGEEETTKGEDSPGYSSGKFIWPVSGYTTISSYYGYRSDPFGGTSTEYHSGIDIPAPLGTAISAVGGGEVAWAFYSSSAGNWIGIDHGNDVYSVYMHMSSLLVEEGDYVSAGDTIGLCGSTGRSTGPHLHLSIRVDGEYVDPLDYVSP